MKSTIVLLALLSLGACNQPTKAQLWLDPMPGTDQHSGAVGPVWSSMEICKRVLATPYTDKADTEYMRDMRKSTYDHLRCVAVH